MELNEERLTQVISESLNIPPEEIENNASLSNEIGIDSIEILKVCRNLVKAFDCDLNVAEIEEADSVTNIMLCINKKRSL